MTSRKINFSPPDISEAEIAEVAEAKDFAIFSLAEWCLWDAQDVLSMISKKNPYSCMAKRRFFVE